MKLIFLAFIIVVITSAVSFAEEPVDTLQVKSISQDSLFRLINNSFSTVEPIFAYSCYDCHSDKTEQPWYYNVPVINGWIEGHIEHGRRKLDFSTGFPFAGTPDQIHLLEEIKEEIEEGEMPIFSYRIMHWGRLIEDEKRDSVFAWIDKSIGLLKAHGFSPQQTDYTE